ncbi:hypothetical protein ACFL1U_01805 [Patescibacteria group bacterium]
MARLLTITRSPVAFSGTRKRTLKKQLAFGRVALSIFTVALLCIFSLLYLIQTNSVSNLGSRIDELEVEKNVLVEQHKALQLEASELSSIRAIEKAASGMSLTKTQLTHMEAPQTNVASR